MSNLILLPAFAKATSTFRSPLLPYLDGRMGLFPKTLSRFRPESPQHSIYVRISVSS